MVETKKPRDIIAIEKPKKTKKIILGNIREMKSSYKKGVFQKISNWQRRPAMTRTREVRAENTMPMMYQLIQ
jgi:hypothetical protein